MYLIIKCLFLFLIYRIARIEGGKPNRTIARNTSQIGEQYENGVVATAARGAVSQFPPFQNVSLFNLDSILL